MSISLILSFKKLTFALITLKIIKNNIITLKVIAYLYFSTYIMCVWRNWFTPSTMSVLETDLRNQTWWQVLYRLSRLVGPHSLRSLIPRSEAVTKKALFNGA